LPDAARGCELEVLISDPEAPPRAPVRSIGRIRFGECFRYESEAHWQADSVRHCVDPNKSPAFRWERNKAKFGWSVASVSRYEEPLCFDRDCLLPLHRSVVRLLMAPRL